MRLSSHIQFMVDSNSLGTMQLLKFHRSGQHTENELMQAPAQKGGGAETSHSAGFCFQYRVEHKTSHVLGKCSSRLILGLSWFHTSGILLPPPRELGL